MSNSNPGPVPGVPGPNAPTDSVKPFGKYFLVRKLAEGGMAEIFLAKQVGAEGFERNVVIKKMLPHLSSVPDFVEMFLDEARLAARLAHQNIIQINDLGLADGCYYICMEYLAGEDFSTLLRTAGRKREYVPLGVVTRVVIEAAHGLHFAHGFMDDQGKPLNVVHRDISPSNIYVTFEGQVKLLDFGIAKAESRVTNTTAGVVKGKYMYMSPEQAKGLKVDRRADVFSLGVSLYEALTNIRPFSRDNDLAILNAVLRSDFKPPRQLRPDLPAELEAVVLKAMSGTLEERYQTAGEMAGDLEKWLTSTSQTIAGSQLAAYTRALFGEERVASKTRIRSLATLKESGVVIPGFNTDGKTMAGSPTHPEMPVVQPPPPPAQARQRQVTSNPPQTAILPIPLGQVASHVEPGPGAPPPTQVAMNAAGIGGRSSRALTLLGGVLIGLLAFGGAFVFLKSQQTVTPTPDPVVATPTPPTPDPVVATPTPPTPVPDPTVGTSPSPPVPDPGPGPDTTPPTTPDPPIANNNPENPEPRTPRPPKPVVLTEGKVLKVVSSQMQKIQRCMETHRSDLPSDGRMSARITILQAGSVSEATLKGVATGSEVGRCVEGVLLKLKFPVHKDEAVTITLPFNVSVN